MKLRLPADAAAGVEEHVAHSRAFRIGVASMGYVVVPIGTSFDRLLGEVIDKVVVRVSDDPALQSLEGRDVHSARIGHELAKF